MKFEIIRQEVQVWFRQIWREASQSFSQEKAAILSSFQKQITAGQGLSVSPLCPTVADVVSDLMSPAQACSTENYPRFLSLPSAHISGLEEHCCAWESARIKASLQKLATKAFVHHLMGERSLSGLPKADFHAVPPSRQQGTILSKPYFLKFTSQ